MINLTIRNKLLDLQQLLHQLRWDERHLTSIQKYLFPYYRRWLEHRINQLIDLDPSPTNNINEIHELKKLFHDHWSLVQNSPLSPTNLPRHLLILNLCDLATALSQYLALNSETLEPLQILMPTIHIESGHDLFPHLNHQINLQRILQTHILSDTGRSLLPVHILTRLSFHESSAESSWFNPYFDYQTDQADEVYLNSSEQDRLALHSELTQAVVHTHHHYIQQLHQQEHLLGQLHRLCHHLYQNSAYQRGSEQRAANFTYEALVHFSQYYHQLSSDQQQRIPNELKLEIQYFLSLCSDRDLHHQAEEALNTCIATRREQLLKKITSHEDLLLDITLRPDEQTDYLQQLKQQLIDKQHQLKHLLEHQQYQGRDNLVHIMNLGTQLAIPWDLTHPYFYPWFLQQSPKSIRSLLNDTPLNNQLIECMKDPWFAIDMMEKLSIESLYLLSELGFLDYLETWIETPTILSSVIHLLSINKLRPLLNSIEHLCMNLLISVDDVLTLFKNADYDKIHLMLDALPTEIFLTFKLDKHYEDFFQLTEIIHTSNRALLLSKIFVDVSDVHELSQGMDEAQFMRLCDLLQPHFKHLIQDNYDAVNLYKPYQGKLIHLLRVSQDALLPHLPSLRELGVFFNNLSSKQIKIFVKFYRPMMISYCRSLESLNDLFLLLTKKQLSRFIQALKLKPIDWIHTPHDLLFFQETLAAPKFNILFQQLLPDLSRIIQHEDELLHLATYLNAECQSFLNLYILHHQDHYDQLFKNALKSLAARLDDEQILAILHRIKPQLWTEIISGLDYYEAFHFLSHELKEQMFDWFVPYFPNMILSNIDMKHILKTLPQSRVLTFYQILPSIWHMQLHSLEGMNILLDPLLKHQTYFEPLILCALIQLSLIKDKLNGVHLRVTELLQQHEIRQSNDLYRFFASNPELKPFNQLLFWIENPLRPLSLQHHHFEPWLNKHHVNEHPLINEQFLNELRTWRQLFYHAYDTINPIQSREQPTKSVP